MNRITASGRSGVIKYGYKAVARLSDWSLDGNHLRGTAVDVDDMWIGQGGPFEVRLPFGRKFWVWKDVTLASIDPVTARLEGRPVVCD